MDCDIETIVNEADCLRCLTPLQIRYATIQLECDLLAVILDIFPPQ